MLIRNIERTFMPRSRGKEVSPLRKTAEGLGLFLDKLSETVRKSVADDDSVDSGLDAYGRVEPSRKFKLRSSVQEEAQPAILNLSASEREAFEMLKDARSLAAEATAATMHIFDRADAHERLHAVIVGINAKQVEVLSPIFSGWTPETDGPLFSLLAPDLARVAYKEIDDIIVNFLNAVGTKNETTDNANGEDSGGHEAAISASEQLRNFLTNEGSVKAFARFREINRSNILGLLQ